MCNNKQEQARTVKEHSPIETIIVKLILLNIIGVPYQRSTYVEYAIRQILEPVVESTEGFPLDGRLNVLTLTVNNMMESWSDWILKQEIVFR